MKYKVLLVLLLFSLLAPTLHAQDNYLIAKNFFMHNGAKLNVSLVGGEQFKDEDEYKYDAAKTTRFFLFDAGKKINLKPAAKDSAAPVLTYPMNNVGLSMVEMIRNIPPTEIEREAYAKYLGDEGLIKLAETVNSSNQSHFKEKKVCYLKTLVMVDKATGGDYDKQLGEEFEIVLKTNPYKLNYGDDLIGVLYEKGKPAKSTDVSVFIKAQSGNIYTDRLITNAKGEFTINVSREGIYMIRCARTMASTGTDADFETVQAAFTFLFNSNNNDTIDYKSFGLPDRH